MKFFKIFLILSLLVLTFTRRNRKSKSRYEKFEQTDKCKNYCRKIANELSYKLEGELNFEGKKGEELTCYGQKDGKKHVIYPTEGKKITIIITDAPKMGFWYCKLQ
jgi:hypothetical protein